jgi:hypothetical protein
LLRNDTFCHTSDGRPCDPYNLPCRHIACVALKVNDTEVHTILCNEVLRSAWFPPIYHIRFALDTLKTSQPIDCAQGQNTEGDLQPPAPRTERKTFSKTRIRSNFQAANDDTSGVAPPKQSSKKRASSDRDSDGVITATPPIIIELGNYSPPSVEPVRALHPNDPVSKSLPSETVQEPSSLSTKKSKVAPKKVLPAKVSGRKTVLNVQIAPQPPRLQSKSSVIPDTVTAVSNWLSSVLG